MKYLGILLAGLISASVFAGNLSRDNCDGDYIYGTYIEGVSYSSNWPNDGSAVNNVRVNVKGNWYGFDKNLSDNGDITPVLITAYLNKIEVNVCVNSGMLRSVEFAFSGETKSKNKSLLKREKPVTK
jgi:hypothetical protein